MNGPSLGGALVTGLGVCCPLAEDPPGLWHAIAAGRTGVAPFLRFGPVGAHAIWASAFAAERLTELSAAVPGADPCIGPAFAAARQALAASAVDPAAPPGRLVLVLGTTGGGGVRWADFDDAPPDDPARRRAALRELGISAQGRALREALGLAGAVWTVSTACASGSHALGLALDLLRVGLADLALVGGTDIVNAPSALGFSSIGAMASGPCAPFCQPDGMNLGEGAAFLVLERSHAAHRRGARSLGVLLGWGTAADAYHATAPDPTGAGIVRGIQAALDDAGLAAEEIGYVNAHGTGTVANDAAEALALRAVFPLEVPVSSNKAQLGHTLGAAGALEAAVTLLALQEQALPPNACAGRPRPFTPPGLVAPPVAVRAEFGFALKLSSAFGGQNAALILAGPRGDIEDARSDAPGPSDGGDAALSFAARRRIGIAGIAPLRADVTRPVAGSTVLPPGPLDRSAALLLRASVDAAADAGLDLLDGDGSDWIGLVSGVADGAEESTDRFSGSRGHAVPGAASSHAFARMVPNAAAGAVARALSLRGPTSTLACGSGAGLAACIQAAILLGSRPSVRAMFAAAADELGRVTRARYELSDARGAAPRAGGVCVVVRPLVDCPPGSPRWVGQAVGGVQHIERVLRDAAPEGADLVCLSSDGEPEWAELERSAARAVFGAHARLLHASEDGGFARAGSSLHAVVLAVMELRAGRAARAVACTVSSTFGSAAIALASP